MSGDKDGVELLPCPNVLCDLSRPFLNETDTSLSATHIWVSCENCGACGPRFKKPDQYFGRTSHWDQVRREAIAAWNTRPTPAHEPVWMPIETAPYNTPVQVKVGHMTMLARLIPNGSEDENGSCDQWQAEHDGEHPPCWSDGACWASNADEVQSLQPSAWTTSPAASGRPHATGTTTPASVEAAAGDTGERL